MPTIHRAGLASAALVAACSVALGAFAAPAAIAAGAPASGLVASYDFVDGNGTTVPNGVPDSVVGEALVHNVEAGDWTADGLVLRGGDKATGTWVELPEDLLAGARTATVTAEVKASAAMLSSFHFLWNIGNDASGTEYFFTSLNCGSGRTPLAGIKSAGVEELAASSSCGVAADRWVNVAVTASDGVLSLYLDGMLAASRDVGFVPGDVADQSLNAIGRSPWPDALFQGEISSFRVYDRALGDDEVAAVAEADAAVHAAELQALAQAVVDALDLADITTSDHISLPTAGGEVSWMSSNPDVVATDGTVTPPLIGQDPVEVELTATASVRGRAASRTITVTVEPSTSTDAERAQRLAEQFVIAPVVAAGAALPAAPVGATITVTDVAGAGVSVADGTISLAGDAAVRAEIEVAVTDESSGTDVLRRFVVTVLPASASVDLLAYSRTPTTANEANNADVALSVHLALAGSDGWAPLNDDYGIFFPKTSEEVPANGPSEALIRSLRDPHLFALPEGGYGIIATRVARGGASDGTQASHVLFARTDDLLSYTEVGMLDVGVTDGVNDPGAVWDSAAGRYVVTWTSDSGVANYTTFADLADGSTRGPVRRGAIAATAGAEADGVADYATGNAVPIPSDTAGALKVRFGPITNTTAEVLEGVTVAQGASFSASDLPERVELGYSDGSDATRAIAWNDDDLAAVDTSAPGDYVVTGRVKQPEYPTPFADERADPSVFRYEANGRTRFLMIATEDLNLNPVDPANGPHMPIRIAERIEDLSDDAIVAGRNVEIDLLTAGDEDAAGNLMTGCFWAPEFHVIDGKLSILFMPCYDGDNGRPDMWTGRASIIQLKQDASGADLDPAVPANWTRAEPVVRADGGILNPVQQISLDMTFFQDSGKSYYAWQMLGAIYIAEVDPTEPTRLTTEPVRILAPEYAWDNTIAEGPNVLERDGTLYMLYSGSTVGDTYTTGLATASAGAGADLADPASWTKLNYPVQKSGMFNGEWQLGTGHGMWSYDEDGNLLYVFHARTDHNGLTGRDMFVRRVHFSADGMPVLDQEAAEEVAPENRAVSVTVTVEAALPFTVEVTDRCVAGKFVKQTVRVVNESEADASFAVASAFGSRDLGVVAAGASESATINTKRAEVPAGQVTVTATARVDGQEIQVQRKVDTEAVGCG
ncbi:family 43 glycosylhydrolase [Microbacterium sp. NPDC056234]|uniref:family 43 glycosylhydrolase n=1 Tax=Microbacterium sp. NPDC056234 TaxID=3345757 RepID=UPI0035D98DA2